MTPFRFTSEDPLGFVDGANRYGYVGNNPMNWIDAFGLTIDNSKGYLCDVYYKPETGKDIDKVLPGMKSGEQDGFVDPITGKMYKTAGKEKFGVYIGGDDVWIGKGGIVNDNSPTTKEVGQEFIDERHKISDKTWDKLWEKAQEIQKCWKSEKE